MNIIPWAGDNLKYAHRISPSSYKVVLHFTVNFRSISVLRHHIFPTYFITESYS